MKGENTLVYIFIVFAILYLITHLVINIIIPPEIPTGFHLNSRGIFRRIISLSIAAYITYNIFKYLQLI